METYKITLKTPTGSVDIMCPDDQYILDAAEQHNDAYGSGKWVLIKTDYHPFYNAGISFIQRVATLEKGKTPDERILWHTIRTLTFEWRPFDEKDVYRSSFEENMYGETRIIEQTYLPELLPSGNFKMRWEPEIDFHYTLN